MDKPIPKRLSIGHKELKSLTNWPDELILDYVGIEEEAGDQFNNTANFFTGKAFSVLFSVDIIAPTRINIKASFNIGEMDYISTGVYQFTIENDNLLGDSIDAGHTYSLECEYLNPLTPDQLQDTFIVERNKVSAGVYEIHFFKLVVDGPQVNRVHQDISSNYDIMITGFINHEA